MKAPVPPGNLGTPAAVYAAIRQLSAYVEKFGTRVTVAEIATKYSYVCDRIPSAQYRQAYLAATGKKVVPGWFLQMQIPGSGFVTQGTFE